MNQGSSILSETGRTRREFISGVAAGAASLTIVPRTVLGGPGYVAPNDRINVAIIGCGGQGLTDLDNLLKFPELQYIAVADPMEQWDYREFYFGGDAGRLPAKKKIEAYYAGQNGKKDYSGCRAFVDFREMLDTVADIDAVTVETTDNLHALAAMAAIKRGKHVYCQKPLTHDIFEARELTLAARQAKVVTQMGNQGHAMEGNKLIQEWIQAGAIGEIREVMCWTDRPAGYWPQGVAVPKETPSVPRVLNWDLWLGPAKDRPYHPLYLPFRWRGFWDFGTGALGDMGCHILDTAVSVLGLQHPHSVESVCTTPYMTDTYPVASIIKYEFAKLGTQPQVTLTWYDGGLMPFKPKELEPGRRIGDNDGGTLFIGSKGTLMCGCFGENPRLIPEAAMKKFNVPEKTLPRSKGIYNEWVDAMLGKGTATSNFDVSGPLTEIALLGNVALRYPGAKLAYDSPRMKVTNMEEANQYIRRQYEAGWAL